MRARNQAVSNPTVHVGRTYEWHEGRIDHDAAVAYAMATNEPNDIYLTGDAVPPLYTAALILNAQDEALRSGIDPGAITGFRAGVHAEHDVSFLAPITPGMSIRWRATTRSIKPTPAGPLLTQQITVIDADDRPLVEHLWSTIFVGGTNAWDLGPALPDHTFPEAARNQPIADVTFQVARDQGFRYGGASGDRPPHSLDDEAARQEGFPSKILQGMGTFAMCSGAVVAQAAGGDPARLRRLAGRFSSPMLPGNPLVAHLYDAGRTDDGCRVVAFEAVSNGETILKHGRAELLD